MGRRACAERKRIDLRKRSRKGRENGVCVRQVWLNFGSHFPSKIDEQIDTKIDAEKNIKKGMQKIVSKKYRKIMPKVIQNDTKMDTKINNFQTFLKKAEMLETICFTIENVVLGT